MDENNNKFQDVRFSTKSLYEKYTYIYIAIFIMAGIPGLFSIALYFFENSRGYAHGVKSLLGLGFSLFIILDWLIGRLVLKYIRKNHRLMLLGTTWKFIVSGICILFMSIFVMIITDTPIKIHLIIFVLANIAGIPMYINWLKHPEKFNKPNYASGAVSSGIFGVIGIMCSKLLGQTGNGNLVPVIAFYASTFAIVMLNIPILLFIYEFVNYDKIYTKDYADIPYDYKYKGKSKKSKKHRMKKLAREAKKNESKKRV